MSLRVVRSCDRLSVSLLPTCLLNASCSFLKDENVEMLVDIVPNNQWHEPGRLEEFPVPWSKRDLPAWTPQRPGWTRAINHHQQPARCWQIKAFDNVALSTTRTALRWMDVNILYRRSMHLSVRPGFHAGIHVCRTQLAAVVSYSECKLSRPKAPSSLPQQG